MSHTDDLERAAAVHQAAKIVEVTAREELHAAMRTALAAGVSQSEIARAAGWDRQNVHRLLRQAS